MERRISPLFGVFSKNPLQVQLFSHQAQYKVHQMPRWYPIQHRWRHQLILFWNPISKCLRHAPIQFLSTVKYGPHYLDRLCEGETRAKRARGSLTHHLELQLRNTSEGRGSMIKCTMRRATVHGLPAVA